MRQVPSHPRSKARVLGHGVLLVPARVHPFFDSAPIPFRKARKLIDSALVMQPVLIVPGLGGSGPEHWQSRWEMLEPSYRRVVMPDWDRPDLEGWVATLGAAVASVEKPPLIVAHSLGCLTVAHWAARGGIARGALLVAVPDPSGPAFPSEARSFADLPGRPLGFPTHVVASLDDPYGSFEFAERMARVWHSALSNVGEAGHINAASGLGDWPAGRALLDTLLA
jgi:uncharacterized protein